MENYSVLMSVYHKERPEYLELSIKSILEQSILTNDFVIVCDGKLTDDLYKVLDQYEERYSFFQIIKYDINKGLGEALNLGLQFCKNEIVFRMDTDDIARRDRAELQLPKIIEGFDIVGTFISEFENDAENIVAYKEMPIEQNEIIKYSKKRNPFNHPSVAFRKSTVLKAGGYKHLPFKEDYYLWVRLIQAGGKCYNVPDFLVNMRSGADMRRRRTNKAARKSLLNLQKYMLKTKYINFFQFVYYTTGQVLFCFLPYKLREKIYLKMLRKKSAKKIEKV